jgi:hypothetical protein
MNKANADIMPVASEEKRGRGRPSLYQPLYAVQAEKLCLLGATDAELADFFDIAESTLNLWKLDHPEFSESLKRGKTLADAHVAERLFQRATGYVHDDVHISNYKGSITVTKIDKHYPPDTTAAIFWLKNRQKNRWRDSQNINVTAHTLEEILGYSDDQPKEET